MPRRLTIEQVRHEIETTSNCKLISTNYVNSDTPLQIMCGCTKIYEARIGNFRHGMKQCAECGYKNGAKKLAKTQEEFEKQVYDLVGDEFEVLSEYVAQNQNVDFLHKDCGTVFSMRPNNFFNNQRCVKCARGIKNHEEYLEEFNQFAGEEFGLLGEYINQRTKLKCIHKNCGHKFEFFPSALRQIKKMYCPNCDGYKGEVEIINWLKNKNINYISQYLIVDSTRLYFDFAIMKHNQLTFIEYQGKQHYIPVRFGGIPYEEAEDNFIAGRKRDNIKKLYCQEHHIKLIEIPYWDFNNIDAILSKEFKNLI